MSFGFGVSDFLAVIKLTSEVRKEFAGAPSQFHEISAELVPGMLGTDDEKALNCPEDQKPRDHTSRCGR